MIGTAYIEILEIYNTITPNINTQYQKITADQKITAAASQDALMWDALMSVCSAISL
jgi:hypothetical protein